ncbi:MAG: hypothetical protein OEZ06_30710 [Myxococcales bacterium]|nr:hypothetical protein [Myxococcales bacterium]
MRRFRTGRRSRPLRRAALCALLWLGGCATPLPALVIGVAGGSSSAGGGASRWLRAGAGLRFQLERTQRAASDGVASGAITYGTVPAPYASCQDSPLCAWQRAEQRAALAQLGVVDPELP